MSKTTPKIRNGHKYWFDTSLKSWRICPVDQNGNQLESPDVIGSFHEMARQYPGVFKPVFRAKNTAMILIIMTAALFGSCSSGKPCLVVDVIQKTQRVIDEQRAYGLAFHPPVNLLDTNTRFVIVQNIPDTFFVSYQTRKYLEWTIQKRRIEWTNGQRDTVIVEQYKVGHFAPGFMKNGATWFGELSVGSDPDLEGSWMWFTNTPLFMFPDQVLEYPFEVKTSKR